MRGMTGRAAFAHRLVFKDKTTGLILMTTGTVFTLESERKILGLPVDVTTMRIVTINAAHFAFRHEVMIRQTKLGMSLEMAIETSLRILPGIDDELVELLPAGGDMSAAGTVTRFAAGFPCHLQGLRMEPAVSAGRKLLHVVRMAIRAGGVANELGTGNLGRKRRGGRECRTGNPDGQRRHRHQCRQPSFNPWFLCHVVIVGSCSALANLR